MPRARVLLISTFIALLVFIGYRFGPSLLPLANAGSKSLSSVERRAATGGPASVVPGDAQNSNTFLEEGTLLASSASVEAAAAAAKSVQFQSVSTTARGQLKLIETIEQSEKPNRSISTKKVLQLCFDTNPAVPCVNTARIRDAIAITEAPLGVWINFSRAKKEDYFSISQKSHGSSWNETFPADERRRLASMGRTVKTAVINSGHLRTYQACVSSLIDRILAPNAADLFLLVYSYLAKSAPTARVVPPHEYMDVLHVVDVHRPFLRQLYILDDAKVKQYISAAFPHGQFRGILAKTLLLELGVNLTLGEQLPVPYDVILKVRPDLYFLGSLIFFEPDQSSSSPHSAANRADNDDHDPIVAKAVLFCHMQWDIYRNVYPAVSVTRNGVFRSPHHPLLWWPGNPVSDHAVFGSTAAMAKFQRMFSPLVSASTSTQNAFIGDAVTGWENTPEKLWTQFSALQSLREVLFVGYHVLLRDPVYFTPAEKEKEAGKNLFKKLALQIFGISDASVVKCPHPSGKLRLPSIGARRKKK